MIIISANGLSKMILLFSEKRNTRASEMKSTNQTLILGKFRLNFEDLWLISPISKRIN